MAYFKVRIQRESNTPRHFNVSASKYQEAIISAALQLREEGINDAKGIEIVAKIDSLRD